MIKIGDKYIIQAEQIDYSAWVLLDGFSKKRNVPIVTKKLIGYFNSPIRSIEAIKDYEVHNCIAGKTWGLTRQLERLKA